MLLTTKRKRLPHVCLVSLFWPWIGSFISELKYLIGWYWLFTLTLKALQLQEEDQLMKQCVSWKSCILGQPLCFSVGFGLRIALWNKSAEGISNYRSLGMFLKQQQYHGE